VENQQGRSNPLKREGTSLRKKSALTCGVEMEKRTEKKKEKKRAIVDDRRKTGREKWLTLIVAREKKESARDFYGGTPPQLGTAREEYISILDA